jgi:hypothetical protein
VEVAESSDFVSAAQALLSDPDLAPTLFQEGEPDPMIFVGNSGNRLSPADLIESLFTAAFQQMHYLRLPLKESTFVRLVIEGYEEMKRAVSGEKARGYVLAGISGVYLPESRQLKTPWGV